MKPSTLSLAVGLSSPIVATGTYSDGSTQNLTGQVTWSSDQPSRASVSNIGVASLVTAVAAGTAHVTAPLGGMSGVANVTLSSAILLAVTVSRASVTDLAAVGGGVAIRDIPSSTIMDSMGYGTAINLFVIGIVAVALPTGQSLSRIPNGQDTHNNSVDFQVTTPTPGAANH